MHNCTGSDVWSGEEYDTKEEAIKAGRKESTGRYFEVGQIGKVEIAVIDADCLLEDIANSVYDQVGEIAEGYLEDVLDEHELELEKSFNEVFLKWAEKNGYKPSFFKVVNIESVKLGGENMKKKLATIAITTGILLSLVGCSQSSRVSSNLSKEADNFNVVRQLTVINCIEGDILFQMTGKLSIKADVEQNQLEVVVEDDKGNYQKHFVGLSDNVTYVVEQKDYKDVSNYKYTLNYNPKMWIPVDIKTVD